jgi:hypothetical protein
LRQQGVNEDIETFLQRAETFFRIGEVKGQNQLIHLMNSAQPKVVERINTLLEANIIEPGELKEALKLEFAVSRFERMKRFRNLKPSADQTIIQFGSQLRSELLKFLTLTEEKAKGSEEIITPLLIDQLVNVLDPGSSSYIKNEVCKQSSLTWSAVLTLAEDYRRNTISATTTQRKQQFCTSHGWGNHSTPNCKLGKGSNAKQVSFSKDDRQENCKTGSY